MEELRKQNKERPYVAFAASLGVSGNTGPFNTDITMIYKNIFTNTGSAYNPNTGIFTAPVRGVYYFSFSGCNDASKAMGLQLYKNGVKQVTVFNHDSGTRYETSTNGISLELEVGVQVYVRLLKNTWVADSDNNHNTFIGHLLFPLLSSGCQQ
ncbi:complement C1q-like protein 2 [Coregonus clupeaformis]|uniref:complement C1q-like protein 2 n=1 Tax=Coregonus clupeaformis TaxID=59861 RepID=UPI001BE0C816|nr:complement C1q-like protein 2 [Coregonus clupeaformis]